jgi:catalase (peroxidase I)
MEGVKARFDGVQTYDQLIPLIDDSYGAWSTYLAELKVLSPPPSLVPFHQSLQQAAEDLVSIYTQLRTAAVNQDENAANAIAEQADAVGNIYESNLLGTLQEFSRLQDELNMLKVEVDALRDRVATMGPDL